MSGPPVFLFLPRAVFRQLPTCAVVGEGSPSPPRQATASLVPQPPHQEGLASLHRTAASLSTTVVGTSLSTASPSLPLESIFEWHGASCCQADPGSAVLTVQTEQPTSEKFSEGPGEQFAFWRACSNTAAFHVKTTWPTTSTDLW